MGEKASPRKQIRNSAGKTIRNAFLTRAHLPWCGASPMRRRTQLGAAESSFFGSVNTWPAVTHLITPIIRNRVEARRLIFPLRCGPRYPCGPGDWSARNKLFSPRRIKNSMLDPGLASLTCFSNVSVLVISFRFTSRMTSPRRSPASPAAL